MGKPTWFVVVSLCLLAQSRAQQASVSTTPITAPDVPQGLIKLDVTATDAAGNPVGGLAQQDFTLLDHGEPQKILSFHASDKSDPPAQVILFVDVLGVQAALANEIRGQGIEFLRRDVRHLSHTVSIFELSDVGLGRVGVPSADGNALAAEVEKSHQVILKGASPQNGSFRMTLQPDRDTAQVTGLKAFGQIAVEERRKPGKKLVLWVGPGFGAGTGQYPPNARLAGDEQRRLVYVVDWFSTLLRDARIVLDVFSIGEREPMGLALSLYPTFLDGPKSVKEVSWMHLYKKVVAIQSGGQAFEPSGRMVNEMESCVRGADAFYTISFDPAKADHPDEYRKVSVQIGKPALTASTNTSYFDQPYYTDEADAATRPVTLQQLEEMLRDSHGKHDGDVAQQLSELRLTERLDGAKLAALAADLRGDKARQQLTMPADASAFLDPPSAEILHDSAPDAAAQRQMISLALDAVNATIPKLPNVIATRTTVRYQEATQGIPGEHTIIVQPLHKEDTSTVMVAYRRGSEVQDQGPVTHRKRKPDEPSLVFEGTFGPSLTAAVDILSSTGRLTWKRWGQGATGRRAVFSFTLPSANLSLTTAGCCLPDDQGTSYFPAPSTYRGEIEIDPVSGALLRLKIRGEPKSTTPVVRADTLIEYGPVDIGGKIYICPLRSIALARERSIRVFTVWDESFRTYGPYNTLLNDISFSNYHVFRAQSRILAVGGAPLP